LDVQQTHLAEADRLIGRARTMIVKQTSHVAELERDGHDARKARQVLALLREALRNMLAHRALILRELRYKS
jgi:hypothetical protein